MAAALKHVETIDIVSFGSSISPEYLLTLLTHAPVGRKQFGIVGTSLPGNGWFGGLNGPLQANKIKWVIGGFFATVRNVGLMIEMGTLSAINFPQGVLAKLLTKTDRKLQTSVGVDTFIDPNYRAGILSIRDGKDQFLGELVTKVSESTLEYELPPVQAVLARGMGMTEDGRIVPETNPIDLDIEKVITAARAQGARCIFQVPVGPKVPNTLDAIHLAENDVVFEAPHELHATCYFPERYLSNKIQIHGRRAKIVDDLADLLKSRVTPSERLIIGIGLPVALTQSLPSLDGCEVNVESGNIGGTPLDGSGFGLNIEPGHKISQLGMFERIWSGDIDHAVLGMGEVDTFGSINIARLGRHTNGVGGFVDISQSLKKVSFCSGRKDRVPALTDWKCFSQMPGQDIAYLEA